MVVHSALYSVVFAIVGAGVSTDIERLVRRWWPRREGDRGPVKRPPPETAGDRDDAPVQGPPALQEFAPGRVIDRKYRLVSELKRGGMGTLFKGLHLWTRQDVVVKVLHAHLRGEHAVQERFVREAQALAQLDHDNAVRVLDAGRDPGSGALYLVEEHLRGEDLAALLERAGPLDAPDALEVMLPVMGVLVSMHRRGMVHRDVNPANIFLARSRTGAVVPKLLDLGVVHLLDDAGSDEATTWVFPPGELLRASAPTTAPGLLIGTPPYMAPEQIHDTASVDARTDVWAVGATLYEVLSGRLPFGDAGAREAIFTEILCGSPAPLESVAPRVPQAVAAAVHRALQRRPADRHQSMQHFIGALLDAAGHASRLRWNTSPPLAHLALRGGAVRRGAVPPPVPRHALHPGARPAEAPREAPPEYVERLPANLLQPLDDASREPTVVLPVVPGVPAALRVLLATVAALAVASLAVAVAWTWSAAPARPLTSVTPPRASPAPPPPALHAEPPATQPTSAPAPRPTSVAPATVAARARPPRTREQERPTTRRQPTRSTPDDSRGPAQRAASPLRPTPRELLDPWAPTATTTGGATFRPTGI